MSQFRLDEVVLKVRGCEGLVDEGCGLLSALSVPMRAGTDFVDADVVHNALDAWRNVENRDIRGDGIVCDCVEEDNITSGIEDGFWAAVEFAAKRVPRRRRRPSFATTFVRHWPFNIANGNNVNLRMTAMTMPADSHPCHKSVLDVERVAPSSTCW